MGQHRWTSETAREAVKVALARRPARGTAARLREAAKLGEREAEEELNPPGTLGRHHAVYPWPEAIVVDAMKRFPN